MLSKLGDLESLIVELPKERLSYDDKQEYVPMWVVWVLVGFCSL